MIEVKKHRSKILLGIAILFMSCSTVERDNPYDKDGTNYGGSSGSAQTVIIHGTPVNYEDETYETVVIGTQTWMARNLNYTRSGSRCYDDNPDNCATYGRLYMWATAMNLPFSCNGSSCSSQILAKHRGICPIGWHIPSYEEWDTLMHYAVVGTKLKASSGWWNSNGTDDYGFSALPGGVFYTDYSEGTFESVGTNGYWWSSSEYNYVDYPAARYMYIGGISYTGTKYDLRSVRCLMD